MTPVVPGGFLTAARVKKIISILEKTYPDAECGLHYRGEGWKLLVLSRLSAQCTDKRVNEVAPALFQKYPTPAAMAEADPAGLEEAIRSCGLFRTKAKDIRASCALLVEKYGGVVPDDLDVLLTFPGVGRKIANLLVGDLYGRPAIVADTHCMRVSGRLGFLEEGSKDALKVEKILKSRVPPEKQNDLCHRFVLLGREYCKAADPGCAVCPLKGDCLHAKVSAKG